MCRSRWDTRISEALCAALITFLTLPNVSHAAWPHSPGINVPICTASGAQQSPVSVSDGAGGAIIAWKDARSGNNDIYAQRVTASGAVDPAWPVNGRALCTSANTQERPQIISDGAGGAIVTWEDIRNASDYDIYAQHVLASGAVDPAWPANGLLLCGAAQQQQLTAILSDGAGGAIVTWQDNRGGPGPADIYAQHVLASGAVDGAWPAHGRALCTDANNQGSPKIASDGAGGAIVTWADQRSGLYDIYAQHVLASGAVDVAWPANGRALCTAAMHQFVPEIVADGAGGAIVTWFDLRDGPDDIYAQRVLASGTVDPAWTANGVRICTASGEQSYPKIISDGAGGAIVTWDDYRSGSNHDVYAQHVLASGAVDGAWPLDGRALCSAGNDQVVPTIVGDGAGGAIVTWPDFRGPNSWDTYAQHVFASGAVDPAWPADGRALSTASGIQGNPTIVADGAGGAIVAWEDFRTVTNLDIYAQRVAPSGYLGNPEPALTSVRDVPNDNGGKVKLSWSASYLDTEQPYFVDHYWIFRDAPPAVAEQALAEGAQLLSMGDPEPKSGERAFISMPAIESSYYWEYVASSPAAHFTSTYSYVASTTSDSMGAGNPKTAFLVVAFNASNSIYFASNPDSGYSVDNVAPVAPAPFTGNFSGGPVQLHWGVSTEPDFALYHLYRGGTADFVPGPGNLVVAQQDTGFVDSGSTWSYYKLSAVDMHGNESGFVAVAPTGSAAGSTPSGNGVVVPLGTNVELTYQNVTSGGQSQLMLQTGGQAPPSGLKLAPSSPPLYYVLTTTATFTGTVTVCVTYSQGDVTGNENNLKLMVYDTTLMPPKWVNITSSRDVTANKICGRTTHFSEFAVMEPLTPLAVDDGPPPTFRLYPCVPNPARSSARVRFGLPRESRVALAVHDLAGRKVRSLISGVVAAGDGEVAWDLRDAAGARVADGIYFLKIAVDGRTISRRVAVVH